VTATVDMRCSECAAIGCECPRGYVADAMKCDVCSYAFVLSAAACKVHIVTCPECKGAISKMAKDGFA